jgi:hypothetical protein
MPEGVAPGRVPVLAARQPEVRAQPSACVLRQKVVGATLAAAPGQPQGLRLNSAKVWLYRLICGKVRPFREAEWQSRCGQLGGEFTSLIIVRAGPGVPLGICPSEEVSWLNSAKRKRFFIS